MKLSKTVSTVLALWISLILNSMASADPGSCPVLSEAPEVRHIFSGVGNNTRGGVILFRHDEKDRASGLLTPRGRDHARSIGETLSSIPVGKVYFATSKQRVEDTAKFAFPDWEIKRTGFGSRKKIPSREMIENWATQEIENLDHIAVIFVFVDSRIINQFTPDQQGFACGEGLLLVADRSGDLTCKARFFPEEWIHPNPTLPPWADKVGSDCGGGAATVRRDTD